MIDEGWTDTGRSCLGLLPIGALHCALSFYFPDHSLTDVYLAPLRDVEKPHATQGVSSRPSDRRQVEPERLGGT